MLDPRWLRENSAEADRRIGTRGVRVDWEKFQLLDEARRRFQELAEQRIRARSTRRAVQPEPRYDEVFEEGIRYLDELAGRSPEGLGGTLEFSNSIWKSPSRTRSDSEHS